MVTTGDNRKKEDNKEKATNSVRNTCTKLNNRKMSQEVPLTVMPVRKYKTIKVKSNTDTATTLRKHMTKICRGGCPTRSYPI